MLRDPKTPEDIGYQAAAILGDVRHNAVEQAQPVIDARRHRLVLDLAPGATPVPPADADG